VLLRIAIELGRMRNQLSREGYDEIQSELSGLPSVLRKLLDEKPGFIRRIAKRVSSYTKWLYIGRGHHTPAALEAALKLKEVTYIPAEGMPGGFMKHGPISMVDEEMVAVILMPPVENEALYKSTLINVSEMKSRGAKLVGLHYNPNETAFDEDIVLPHTHSLLAPIPQLVAGQLLAYFCAILLKRHPDNPRGLAKSVTVE